LLRDDEAGGFASSAAFDQTVGRTVKVDGAASKNSS